MIDIPNKITMSPGHLCLVKPLLKWHCIMCMGQLWARVRKCPHRFIF